MRDPSCRAAEHPGSFLPDRVADRHRKGDAIAKEAIQEVLKVPRLLIRSAGDLLDLIIANLFHDNSLYSGREAAARIREELALIAC